MKRNVLVKVIGISLLAATLTGCVSSSIKSALANGDDVGAIERMAPSLTKKPDNKELVPSFESVYPSAVLNRTPVKTISEIKKENIASYGSSDTAAISKCLSEISADANISSHKALGSVFYLGEESVKKLSELVRIQNAVKTMPSVIGGKKTGYEITVKKSTEDFAGQYSQAKKELAQVYYNVASTAFPGETVNRKKDIINYYKKASEYDSSYSNSASKINQLSYEIAVLLKPSAVTKTQLEEVLSYLNQAGSYKDTANQILEVKFKLAELYRADKTTASYEKAGQLYTEAAGYGNAANEAKLYKFYKYIKNLKKTNYDGDVALTAGVYYPFTFKRSYEPVTENTSKLTLTGKSSNLNVYSRAVENSIFPGAVISGSSIPSQELSVITAGARNPLEFKIAMNSKNYKTGIITNSAAGAATHSQIRAAAKTCQGQIEPEFTYDFERLESMYDIAVAGELGADRSKVSFTNENTLWLNNKSYTLVKVTQKFYTANVTPPDLPIDFFSAKGTVIDQSAVGSVSPYYIESVDYGRKAYFLISSYLSSQEIISDLEKYRPADSKNTGVTATRVNSAVSTKWRNYGTVINAVTVSEKNYKISDIDGIYSWIKTGVDGNVAYETLPPIAFRMKDIISGKYAVLTQEIEATVIANNPSQHTTSGSVSGNVYGNNSAGSGNAVSGNVNVNSSSSSSGSVSGNVSVSTSNGQVSDEVLFPFMSSHRTENSSSGSVSGNTSSGSTSTSGSVSGNVNNGSSTTTGSITNNGSSSTAGSTTNTGSVSGNTGTGSGSTGSGNAYTSLVFVGKKGVYYCSKITLDDEWIYYINEDDILFCCASWDSTEYQTVYVNGINMTKNSTVYSFRDVIGNNISLDIVDKNGNRKHHLLRIYKN